MAVEGAVGTKMQRNYKFGSAGAGVASGLDGAEGFNG